ncbi:MAG: ribosome small subunit-dependent GTPase A [Bacteroidetes bacterium]|nr:ribosome small subunit-dependent GTPase A [Bacteroidota bacterium]
MKGIVLKSTGSWYQVLTADGKVCKARVRGKIRLHSLDTSNPVAVGDEVILGGDTDSSDGAQILDILPCRNYIIRKSNKLSARRQILAANLDAAILVVSLVAPRTSMGFADRFLLCSEAFHIPAILFFNKTDLLNEEGKEVLQAYKGIYDAAGYRTVMGSALTGEGVAVLKSLILGKTVLIAGHSGAGKSTLLNDLFPQAGAKTAEISKQHETGRHTTTFAEMHLLPDGTRIVDTPGIRDFGVVDIPTEETGGYFPEFRRYQNQCRFNNCRHENEPGCAVMAAVESGNIPPERYYSYLSIVHGEDVFE